MDWDGDFSKCRRRRLRFRRTRRKDAVEEVDKEKNFTQRGKTMTRNEIPMRKINRTNRSLFPGGINYDNDNKEDDDGKFSFSLTVFIIVAFINQYTYNLYLYNTIASPTFFWNNSHTLFSCSFCLLI